MQKCPTHNVDLVHRQGTSKKTNKPYDFWACPEKVGEGWCDYSWSEGQRKQIDSRMESIDKLHERLDDMGAFFKGFKDEVMNEIKEVKAILRANDDYKEDVEKLNSLN